MWSQISGPRHRESYHVAVARVHDIGRGRIVHQPEAQARTHRLQVVRRGLGTTAESTEDTETKEEEEGDDS